MADEKKSIFNFVIRATDSTSKGFWAFNQNVKKSTEGLNRLGKSLKDLRRESGLAQLQNRANGLGRSFRNLGGDIRSSLGLVTGLAAKASLVLGAGGGGVLALASGAAKAGDEAARSARLAGVAAQSWQAFAYAADKADLSSSTLQGGLQELSKRAYAAAGSPSGSQAGFFKAAKIDIFTDESKKELKSNERLFLESADALKKLVDAGQYAQALTVADGLFGGQGKQMLDFLAQGSAGLRAEAAEAAKKGLIFSAADIARGKEFNDSLSGSQKSVTGLGHSIAQGFLPTLTRLSNRFQDVVDANRPLMQQKATEWAERFEKKLPDLEKGLLKIKDAASGTFGVIDGGVQLIGGWDNALIGIGGIMGLNVAAGFLAAAKSAALFGAAVATTPIGMLALAAAAVYALYQNWEKIDPYIEKAAKPVYQKIADIAYDGDIEAAKSAKKAFHDDGGWMSGYAGTASYDTAKDALPSASDARAEMQSTHSSTSYTETRNSNVHITAGPGVSATMTGNDPAVSMGPAMSGASL